MSWNAGWQCSTTSSEGTEFGGWGIRTCAATFSSSGWMADGGTLPGTYLTFNFDSCTPEYSQQIMETCTRDMGCLSWDKKHIISQSLLLYVRRKYVISGVIVNFLFQHVNVWKLRSYYVTIQRSRVLCGYLVWPLLCYFSDGFSLIITNW